MRRPRTLHGVSHCNTCTEVGRTEIVPAQSLYTRRLVHELQKHLVQARVLLDGRSLDQLDEAREDALGLHHLECDIVLIVAAVEEEKGCDDVQSGIVILLEETVYDLAAHIFLVGLEEGALAQKVDASSQAIVGLQVVVAVVCGDAEIGAQSIINQLVFVALRRDNVVDLCFSLVSSGCGMSMTRDCRLHPPSQNCCSFSRLYDTSNAMLGSRDERPMMHGPQGVGA